MHSRCITCRMAFWAAALLALGSAANLQADYYWCYGGSGTYGGTGIWDGGVKWLDGSVYKSWTDGNFARFAGTAGTVTNDSARSVGGLVFNSDGYVLQGSGLITLSNSSWALRVLSTTGSLGTTINSNLAITGTSTAFINLNTNAPLTINGVISGSTGGNYAISMGSATGSSGVIVLSGANTFTDKITFTGGVVSVATVANAGTDSNLGRGLPAWAAGLTFDGGALQYTGGNGSTNRWFKINDGKTAEIEVVNASTTLTLSGQFSSSGFETTGSLLKTGDGTLALSGSNYFTGGVTIRKGALSVAAINNGGVAGNLGKSSAAAANLVFDGGTLLYTGSTASTDRAFTIADGKAGTINVSNSSSTLTMSGNSAATTGQLIKAGSGTLALSGANSYSGGTTINAGQLRVSNAGALGSGDVSIAATGGKKLVFAFAPGSVNTIDNNIWIHASGVTSGSSPELQIYQSASTNDLITVRLTGLLTGGSASALYCLGGAGESGYNNTALVLDNTNNTFAGQLYVPRGWIGVGASGALGNASLYVTANIADAGIRFYADNLSIANNVDFIAGAIDTQGYTGTISGNIGNSASYGSLYKIGDGKLILSGNNTFTNAVTFKEGVLSVATVANAGVASNLGAGSAAWAGGLTFDGGALQYTGATASTNRWAKINDGKTAAIEVSNAGTTLTLSGQFSSSGAETTGSLLKTGDGALALSGVNYYTGATTVSAGSLIVNGSIARSSGVSLAEDALLAGSGFVSDISGAGSVNPGNSPGILTAQSIDPSAGTDFAFEFTSLNSPNYGNATASLNDVLRLTGGTPTTAALTSENVIDLYFGVASLAAGDTFRGGFYVDVAGDDTGLAALMAAIEGASYNYYVLGDGAGSHAYGGASYYTLDEFNAANASAYAFAISTAADTAAFAGGTVSGGVMQFAVVPEPNTLALLTFGLISLIAYAWRRRK